IARGANNVAVSRGRPGAMYMPLKNLEVHANTTCTVDMLTFGNAYRRRSTMSRAAFGCRRKYLPWTPGTLRAATGFAERPRTSSAEDALVLSFLLTGLAILGDRAAHGLVLVIHLVLRLGVLPLDDALHLGERSLVLTNVVVAQLGTRNGTQCLDCILVRMENNRGAAVAIERGIARCVPNGAVTGHFGLGFVRPLGQWVYREVQRLGIELRQVIHGSNPDIILCVGSRIVWMTVLNGDDDLGHLAGFRVNTPHPAVFAHVAVDTKPDIVLGVSGKPPQTVRPGLNLEAFERLGCRIEPGDRPGEVLRVPDLVLVVDFHTVGICVRYRAGVVDNLVRGTIPIADAVADQLRKPDIPS